MKLLCRIINALILAFCACSAGIVMLGGPTLIIFGIAILLFIPVNIIPLPYPLKLRKRLRICAEGVNLLESFLIAVVLTVIAHLIALFSELPIKGWQFAISCIAAFLILAIPFWNGILRVYLTSVQLGLKYRVIGIVCGMIPIAHLIALIKILMIVKKEIAFENKKDILNESRKEQRICATQYPLLMVHGVFFRDYKYLNYWGRIPEELEKNGAVVYYGNHQSALSVEDSGRELAERIQQVLKATGAEKVNVIAHSKGGLDCRSAIANCHADQFVASLTTINTPHRGCMFADYLLEKVPEKVKNTAAKTYDATLKKLGDSNPDFLAAVCDLTHEKCSQFNENTPDSENVFYQSVGSKLNKATNGKFPLNFTYHLAKYFDGDNDGLVAENSFAWGNHYTFLTTDGNRGISHGDMVDLNRENIDGFDVREFYVNLVNDLKQRGF